MFGPHKYDRSCLAAVTDHLSFCLAVRCITGIRMPFRSTHFCSSDDWISSKSTFRVSSGTSMRKKGNRSVCRWVCFHFAISFVKWEVRIRYDNISAAQWGFRASLRWWGPSELVFVDRVVRVQLVIDQNILFAAEHLGSANEFYTNEQGPSVLKGSSIMV